MITYTVTFEGKEISIEGDGDSYLGEAGVSILTVESWPDEWTGFSKFVIFRLPDGTLLEPTSFGDVFTLPGTLLADSGELKISFAGYKDGVEIIRSGIATIPISNTLKDTGNTTSWSSVVTDCIAATEDAETMTASFENATASATTLAEGEAATVSLTDGALGKEFAFGIPKGDKGDTGDTGEDATIEIGTVTTLDAGELATVENIGMPSAAVFDFGIPKGVKGDMGEVSTAEMNAAITAATSITLTNLVTNGDVATSLLSDATYTQFGIKPDGTWVFNNAYSSTEQRFSLTAGHRIYLRTQLAASSVGRLRSQSIIHSSGVSTSGVPVDNSILLSNIITVTTSGLYNFKCSESTSGLMERKNQILIDLTELEAALGREVTVDEINAIMDIYDGWFDGSVNLSLFQLIMTIINLFHQ